MSVKMQNAEVVNTSNSKYLTDFINQKDILNDIFPDKKYIEEVTKGFQRISRPRLIGVSDLVDNGLSFTVSNWGKTKASYNKISEISEATVGMDGRAMPDSDRLEYERVGVPIPMYMKYFDVSERELQALQSGQSDDPNWLREHMDACVKVISEKIEHSLFNGVPNITVDGSSLYGYLDFPDAKTLATLGPRWTNLTGRDILGDVEKLLTKAYENNRENDLILYIPRQVYQSLFQDYKAQSSQTFMQRILDNKAIKAVKATKHLSERELLLVHMDKESVDYCNVKNLTTITLPSEKPMTNRMFMFQIFVHRLKSDIEGQSGIFKGIGT